MIKYMFQTLKKYFGQCGQTILATTKNWRFYNGHNGLTEFTCITYIQLPACKKEASNYFGNGVDFTLMNPREDTHTAASLRYDVQRMMMS